MDPNHRPQRNVFLLFLGTVFVALMSALPLVVAQNAPQPEAKAPDAAQGATARQTAGDDNPSFDQADRNHDGFLDKSEAGRIPGLSANFERADRNRDGKLDQAEFEKGLQILQVRR
jgi:hypothetical protein